MQEDSNKDNHDEAGYRLNQIVMRAVHEFWLPCAEKTFESISKAVCRFTRSLTAAGRLVN